MSGVGNKRGLNVAMKCSERIDANYAVLINEYLLQNWYFNNSVNKYWNWVYIKQTGVLNVMFVWHVFI